MAPAPRPRGNATNVDRGTTRSIYVPPFRVDVTTLARADSFVTAAELARTMAAALKLAGAPSPASIGLVLADDRELARLNRAHMGHRGPTDVLSFPLLEPSSFPPHEGEPHGRRLGHAVAFATVPGRRQELGDVVVSVERAVDQARSGRGGQTGDVRWSEADELRLLAVHGTLHVCGWDHAQPAEGAAMRSLEKRILAARR